MTVDVEIRDVSPRDGLQDHPTFVATETKAELVRRLTEVGVSSVEVTSFVSPKVVPQLADAADLCRSVVGEKTAGAAPAAAGGAGAGGGPGDGAGPRFAAFVGTRSWLGRALVWRLDEISMAVPATDGMSQANFRRDTAEMLAEADAMRRQAPQTLMSATVAVAFGCPYDGAVSTDRVLSLAASLGTAGYERIILGDTIGVADPAQVRRLVTALVRELPDTTIGVHFHDSRGAAVANVIAAVEAGATLVDASLAGIGGCPFAPGAAGNVALEDVVWVLEAMGVGTGIDRTGVAEAARWLADTLEIPLASKTPRHRLFTWEKVPA